MLKETIIADLTQAMKAREELKTSTLRMLKAEIMKYEVSGANKVATDDVVTDLIKKSIKQRKEAAEGFDKGGNAAMAQKEREEASLLETYLPAQMTEDELRNVVRATIAQMGATASDFGKVIGAVMGQVKGKADGGMVSRLVKETLA